MGPDSFILTYKFFERSRLGSWRPPYEVGAPLREILDPLLQATGQTPIHISWPPTLTALTSNGHVLEEDCSAL